MGKFAEKTKKFLYVLYVENQPQKLFKFYKKIDRGRKWK